MDEETDVGGESNETEIVNLVQTERWSRTSGGGEGGGDGEGEEEGRERERRRRGGAGCLRFVATVCTPFLCPAYVSVGALWKNKSLLGLVVVFKVLVQSYSYPLTV